MQNLKLQSKVKNWVIPLFIAVSIFAIVRPTLAQLAQEQSIGVQVGDEIGANGYRQIYYVWEGEKIFITNTDYSNGQPDTDGEQITWMGMAGLGSWQIFLYHIPTGITTPLSTSSNNANPKVSKGKVVWERWQAGGWQIFLFDGVRVRQITEGELSTNPAIEGDLVTYSRKDAAGTTRKDTYSIPSHSSTAAPPTVTPEEVAPELGAIPGPGTADER